MPTDFSTEYEGVIIRLRTPDESAMFPGLVKEALRTIHSKPVGKSLLDQIVALKDRKQFGYTVCIMRPQELMLVDKNDGKGPQWNSGSVAKRGNEQRACNGQGTVTQVIWNANVIATPDGTRPGFVGLAHELVHALYSLKGEGFIDTPNEEYRTVGIPPFNDAREITENRIREEHGLNRRSHYTGVEPPT